MVAVSPSVGPSSGGTVVTVKLAGVIPEGQETFFCKFGEKVVLADSFYYTEELSPAIVCTAPDFGSGAGAVELKISFDGITYTKSGSAFYYHDDIGIDNILPSLGTHMGGTTVDVRLNKSPMPSSFEVGLTTVPALCKFGTIDVSGQYVITNDGPAVVCKTPGTEIGVVNVKISLDGQHFSSDSVAFTFSLDADEVNLDHRMAVSRYLVEAEPEGSMSAFKNESFYFYNGMAASNDDAVKELMFYEFYAFYDLGPIPFDGVPLAQEAIPKIFDYLPFSPDYCLFFNVGPDTSLEKLEISDGVMYPAFDPSTFVYVTSVVKETDCLNVTAFPTDKNVRSVSVGGMKIKLDSTSKCIPLAVGENLIDVVVTGQDGQTSRTYSLVAVRLQGTKSGLSDISILDTTTNTVFNSSFFNTSVLDYDITLDVSVNEVILTPIPEDSDALVTVVVNGATTYFGGQQVKTTLNAGNNVFEVTVEAEDGVKKTVYTFNLMREGAELLSLELASDNGGVNPIALSPAFDPNTLVYTATAGSTDIQFYLKLSASTSATVEIAYDIGATSYTCIAGLEEGVTKNVVSDQVYEFCNPAGTNTLTITVKYGSLTSVYQLSVKRTAAAGSLESLATSAGLFEPLFDSNIYNYELVLKHTTSAITFTPTVGTAAKTTMSFTVGSSTFSISSGSTTSTIATNTCGLNDKVTIVVTAEDGISTVTYTIQIVKLAEGIHSQLADMVLVNSTAGTITPMFQGSNPGAYEVVVLRSHKTGTDTVVGTDPVDVTFSWNMPVVYSSYGNFMGSTDNITLSSVVVDKGTGAVVRALESSTIYNNADSASSLTKTLDVKSGEKNIVVVNVAACDGRTSNAYVIDVLRGQGSNANMCNMAPAVGAFDTAFSTSDTLYMLDVAGDATSIGVTPTICDSFATIEVGACSSSSLIPWTSGAMYTKTLSSDFSAAQVSTLEFCVTSEDETVKKTYSVTITRPLSSEAVLKTMGLALAKWDGDFTFTNYDGTVTPIAATNAIAATFEDTYFMINPEPTIATAKIEMVYGGVTYTLTAGANSQLFPAGPASCVAPSVHFCDAPATLCPEMSFGENIVTIKVTSQDGVNSSSYQFIITRSSITYASTVADIYLIGHPILGLPELATAAGLTTATLTQNFAAAGVDTATVTKYGSFVAQEQIFAALKTKGTLPIPAAASQSSLVGSGLDGGRYRIVDSPDVQFLYDVAQKMITANTLVDRVSSGYVFGDVSTATLGDTEADSSPRVYIEPLFLNPYQSVKVEGVVILPGCGVSVEADFGDNEYKVEVFDGTLTELKQYNVTVTRPYLPEGLLSDVTSDYLTTEQGYTDIDQAFANTTFVYTTTVATSDTDVTLQFSKYVSTSYVTAMLFYDGVLQSTVSSYTATKFVFSPYGNTTVMALVSTADGTDGGLYSFNFLKYPTLLKTFTAELADGTALPFTPAFVDPTVDSTAAVQTAYTLSQIDATEIFLAATTLSTGATLDVKIGTTAVAAIAGKYTIPIASDSVTVSLTVTLGAASTVYSLTISKELKEAAAAQSKAAGALGAFAAGEAAIPITGLTAAGSPALSGNFTCQVTGDTTTFDKTYSSVFVSPGVFSVPLTDVTIAGSYSYLCSLNGVPLGTDSFENQGTFTLTGSYVGSKSIMSLVSTEAVRGTNVQFKIQTKDDYGNDPNFSLYPFVAEDVSVGVTQSDGTLMPVTVSSADTTTGVGTFFFTPDLTYSGLYTVIATVKVGGLDIEIIGSGIQLATTVPVTAASAWQVVYSPVYTAGGVQNVVIQPKAGETAYKEQTILVSLTGETRTGTLAATSYSCANRATVACTVPLGLTISGNYTLTVTVGGSLVGLTTYGNGVTGTLPTPIDTVNSVFPGAVSAGALFDIKLLLTDVYGKPASLASYTSAALDATYAAFTHSTIPSITSKTTIVINNCNPSYACELSLGGSLLTSGSYTYDLVLVGSLVSSGSLINVLEGAALPSATVVTPLQPTMTAGFPVSLSAVPKDAYGNTIKVSTMDPAEKTFEAVILSNVLAKTTVFDVTGDVFTADLVITKAGTFNVIFKLGGTVAFEYAIVVSAGAIALENTKITIPTVTPIAGIATGYTVTFSDAFDNVIAPDATTSFVGSAIYKSLVDGEGVVYDVFTATVKILASSAYLEFVPFVSGQYELALTVNGVSAPDLEYLVVDPGTPSAPLSSVSGNVLGATAGVAETAEVTVYDAFGNVHKTGTVSVAALALVTPAVGAPVSVPTTITWDAVAEVYMIAYTVNTVGSLDIEVSIDGIFLTKGLSTVVNPGPFSAATSTITGDTVVVKGQPGILTIQAKDSFGNDLIFGGALLEASKSMPASATDDGQLLFIQDNIDGTYTITYTFAIGGTAAVNVNLLDSVTFVPTALTSPAIEVKESSGAFSLAASTIDDPLPSYGTADKENIMYVTARDEQGVFLGSGGLHWSVKAYKQDTDASTDVLDSVETEVYNFTYVDDNTGTYAIKYTIPSTGNYKVELAVTATKGAPYTDGDVLGSVTTYISAGTPNGANTLYTGAVGTTFQVGATQEFAFSLRDVFNNTLLLETTEQSLASVTAYLMQAGVKTPLSVIFKEFIGAFATGTTTFVPDTEAPGEVFIDVGGSAIAVTTFSVTPGPIATMLVTDPNVEKVAGTAYSYTVSLSDSYSNPIEASSTGDISACTATAIDADSVTTPLTCTLGVGTDDLTVSFTLSKAGEYTVLYTFEQQVGGVTVPYTSPSTVYDVITIIPSSASSLTSLLEGVSDKQITAGQPSFYTLTLSDAFGNFLNDTTIATPEAVTVDSTITVGLTVGAVTTILSPVLVSPGVYQIPFGTAESLIAEPTSVVITVALNAVPLKDSPFTVPLVNILPAKTDVDGTIARYGPQTLTACTSLTETACEPHLTVVAGTSATVELYAYNTLGIPQVFKSEVVGASARVVSTAGQTVDAGDTSLTAEPTVTYVTGQGIYEVAFSANMYQDAGEEVLYAVDIVMDAGDGFKPVYTVYFTVQPTSALPSATKIVATLSKISTYASLSNRYLFAHNQINTNDKFGNQAIYDPANPILITAAAVGPSAAAIFIEPILDASGDISGQYILGVGATVAGTYYITITINGVDLEAYSVTIDAGALDPMSISLVSADSVAGVAATGKLTGTDIFGNQLSSAALTTALTGATVTYSTSLLSSGKAYTDAESATYLQVPLAATSVIDFGYTPKLAGSLEITADVALGADTASSFKKYTVSAAAVSTTDSVVSGPALAGFLESTATYFTVAIKDAFGNLRIGAFSTIGKTECEMLTVTIAESTVGTTVTPTITTGTESCIVSFTAPAGTFDFTVNYDTSLIKSFSAAAVAVVGDPDVQSTLVAGLGYGDIKIEAGTAQTFSVSLVAENGLLVPESQGATYVQMTMVDSLGVDSILSTQAFVTVNDNLNGEYSVFYTVTATGNYTLGLLVDGTLFGTAKAVEVFSTQSFAENVTAIVPATAVAGDIDIPVSVIDKLSNPQTYDLYEVDAMQINIVETFETFVVEMEGAAGAGLAEVTLQTAGIYTVQFFFGDTMVSSTKMEVVAGEADVGSTVVYGEGLSSAKAGVLATFFMELSDEFGNLVANATTATDFVNDVTATLVKVGDATTTIPVVLEVSIVQEAVKATYTITATGDYYLSLVHTDEATTPATVTTYTSFAGYVSTTVVAGNPTAATITASGVPTSVFAGDVDFNILLADAYGNAVTTDQFINFFIVARGYGESLGEVTIASADAVTWTGDKYSVSMPVTTAGTYNLEISRGVEAIADGNPYPLTIAAAPIYTPYTVIDGTGIANFTAGTAVEVSVSPADQFNNTVDLEAGASFKLEYRYSTGEIETRSSTVMPDKSIVFSGYTVTAAAESLSVVVLYSADALGTEVTTVATYTITVAPGVIDADETVVSYSGTTAVNETIAGQAVDVLVYPKDAYGNVITLTDAVGFASYIGLTGAVAPPAVEDFTLLPSGVLSKTVLLTVAGDYVGDVLFQGATMIAGGLKLKVDTSDVDMTATTVTGPTSIVAGTPTSLSIEFADKYGNIISEGKTFMDTASLALPVTVGVSSFASSVLSRSFNVVQKNYVITFQSDKAGLMTLQYSVDGIPVYQTGSTPYSYPVSPTTFDVAQTTVFGLDALAPGQSEVFFIEPRDSLANALDATGIAALGAFTVTTIDSITPTVTLNPDTLIFEVRFTTGDAASLGLGTVTESTLALEVAYDGTVFQTLSTPTFFAAGTISAANSLMVSEDTGVTVATAPATEKGFSTAGPVSFVAVFKDTNNIAKPLTTAELSNVRASVVPSAVPSYELTVDGAVKITFSAQSAADYIVQVFYNDEAIQGGARAGFTVSAGPADATTSFVSLDTTNAIDAAATATASAVLAGTPSVLYVVAKDQFGNNQDASSPRANVVASMVAKSSVTDSILDLNVDDSIDVVVKDISLDGQGVYHIYKVEYTATVAGEYTLSIGLGATRLDPAWMSP